jgi:hypothetical protein
MRVGNLGPKDERPDRDRRKGSIGFEGRDREKSALEKYPDQGVANTGGAPYSAVWRLDFNGRYKTEAHKCSIPTSSPDHKGRIKIERSPEPYAQVGPGRDPKDLKI